MQNGVNIYDAFRPCYQNNPNSTDEVLSFKEGFIGFFKDMHEINSRAGFVADLTRNASLCIAADDAMVAAYEDYA